MQETWKPIPGYEGHYEVSNQARVRSLKRDEPRILKPAPITSKGYPAVSLWKNGSEKTHYVHRLVAEAFCNKPRVRLEVNHINGDVTDNRPENLEWVTHCGNMRHAHTNGFVKEQPRGVKHPRAKLNPEKVRDMRRREASGESINSIASDYDVDWHTARKAIVGINWSHVD